MGTWTKSHSKSGIWRHYLSGNKIFEDNKTEWRVYEKQNLNLEETGTIAFDQFDYREAIPAPVVTLSVGKRVDTINVG